LPASFFVFSFPRVLDPIKPFQQASEQGDFKTAQIHLKNILKEQPDNLQARIALARLYELNKEADKANLSIKALYEQYPYEADVLLLMCYNSSFF